MKKLGVVVLVLLAALAAGCEPVKAPTEDPTFVTVPLEPEPSQ